MEKRKPESYAFPCSVIRANEKKILSKGDYEKLLECKSVNQAMPILSEFGYGDGKELANPRDFEGCLKTGLAEANKLVYSVAPEKAEVELFIYPNDYHNVKALIKAEILKMEAAPYLVESGRFSAHQMEQMVREREFNSMTSEMKHAINEALELYAKAEDPQDIDIVLDRACYKDMLLKAKETGNDFIIGYVKLMIDILNINSFIRLREIRKPATFYQRVYLAGGNIEEKFLENAWDEGYPQLSEKLAPFGFKDAMAVGAMDAQSFRGRYSTLERITDNMRMKYVKNAKYVSFGVEPLIGYLVAKETEIKNLRMILTGIVAEIPRETTQERLRASYV